jgi:radical SAM-linked protein
MNNNTPIVIRIKFKKVGNLQYVSHLDLVRTMHKIIVRSKLPLWYTEGFNPKPKMVFAAPLSIGTESLVEFMDLRLVERIDPALAITALNANMTDELVVLDAYYPDSKLTDLKWLSYVITLNTIGASPELADKVNAALAADTMPVAKKQKPDDTMDIKPLIRFANAVYDAGNIRIDCTLSADASSFLNPEYLVKYLRSACGVLSSGNLMAESYTILRHGAYTADMSDYR